MEFANADDALALWKIISDNTWVAVQQQQRQSLSQPSSPYSSQPQASAATQTHKPIPTIKPVQHMLPAKPKPTLRAAAGGMSL